jgi:hypothetical protein
MPNWCYNHATFSHEDPAMMNNKMINKELEND